MLDIQIATTIKSLPTKQQFQQWVNTVLTHEKIKGQLTIRLVDHAESQYLNQLYRHQDKPTNVLSFPIDNHVLKLKIPLLGDLVICAPLILKEAEEQGKKPLDHWAHLVIHGTLHLLNYVHEQAEEATIMENLEIKLLTQLGIANPYESA